jgi:hypothetical protein
MGIAQQPETIRGDVCINDEATPDGIVKVVIDISNNIANSDHPAFKRLGKRAVFRKDLLFTLGVSQDTVSHLLGEIQAPPVSLQHIYNPQTLCMMRKSIGKNFVQDRFAGMTERGVAKVVTQSNGFGKYLIELKGLGHRSCDLGNLQGMGEPRAVVISGGREKNLGLVFETAERLGVDDPISVTLEGRSDFARFLGD